MKNKFTGYKILKNLYYGSIETIQTNVVTMNHPNQYYYYFYNNESKMWAIPQACSEKDPILKAHIRKGLELVKSEHFNTLDDILDILNVGKNIVRLECELAAIINKNTVKKETYEKPKLSGKFVIRERLLVSCSK